MKKTPTRRAGLLAASVSTLLHGDAVGELTEQLRKHKACTETKVPGCCPPFGSVSDIWSESGANGGAISSAEAVNLGNSLLSDGC